MTLNQAGAMISRAAGALLIFSSAAAILQAFYFVTSVAGQTAGWTSYSPSSSVSHISYQLPLNLLLPQLARLAAGFLLIFFSRVAGHWLARGLDRPDEG